MKRVLLVLLSAVFAFGVVAQESVTTSGTLAIEVTTPAPSSEDSQSCKLALINFKTNTASSDPYEGYINTCAIAFVKIYQPTNTVMIYLSGGSNDTSLSTSHNVSMYVSIEEWDYLKEHLSIIGE